MRLNRYIAQATGLSRRAADEAIKQGRVMVNNTVATLGYNVQEGDRVTIDNLSVKQHGKNTSTTVILYKPVGYVCSRNGQGSKTVYDLLPPELHHLKPIGRLDKDSSGLLLLTSNGKLAQQLTHPSFKKEKIYEIELSQKLSQADRKKIERGIKLRDGLSKLSLRGSGTHWTVSMHEGRNRQIRRTFEALGYHVTKLHRTQIAHYVLDNLAPGQYKTVST